MSGFAAVLDPVEARFQAKVAAPDENNCHLWTAYKDRQGYGHFRLNGKTVKAHRYAAGMLDWPSEIVTRHTCHVPACVNPEHLQFGSVADNSRDRDEAGRTPRGEQHGSSKFSDEQVLEIRRRYAAGNVTQQELGDEFGVDRKTVSVIVRRETWEHLKDEVGWTPGGGRNGSSKLSAEQVLEIRRRYAAGGVTQEKLADEFGVDRTAVHNIVRRKTWTHLADEQAS